MKDYTPKDIESKWQQRWEDQKLYATPVDATRENNMYILPQLPYPSGSGLHVGHAEVYTACDIFARYQRMIGKKVLQVIGWDAFGLPAENYAIKTNVHPRKSTNDAIDNFRSQIKALGISVDWDREVGSHNPDYYKWTQWFFLLMYNRGLAYRKMQAVNWCDSCKTVLANEQVVDGTCERCDTVIVQRDMEQWYLRITDYADRLIDDLDKVDWPKETIERQRNWIGRSEGAEIDFRVVGMDHTIRVFTTRPDTIFGVTYMVLAPEHALVEQVKDTIENWPEVEAYRESTAQKTELDRQIEQEKTGVELKGIRAMNPATGEEIPVWIADYVLASYGTGAIMAVPAHDERDFAFAKKFKLKVKQVVAPDFTLEGESAPREGIETLWNRHAVDAIIENVEGTHILLIKDGPYIHFPGGGIDAGEDKRDALKREVIEETGYCNFDIKNEVIEYIFCYGYRHTRQKNQHSSAALFHVQLTDTSQVFNESDEGKHALLWVEKSEVGQLITWPHHKMEWDLLLHPVYTGEGKIVASDFLNDLTTAEAKEKAILWLEEQGIGKRKTQYKLRDWSVSRQRFWGAPIPMLRHKDTGELRPIPEKDLPVILPDDVDFKPTGESPLNYSPSFQDGVEETYGEGWRREVDTLDTFMCSSWYYYRYLDPHNGSAFASPEQLKTWMPVDFYLGGEEHVNGHLLYARFFTKVLFDAGYIDFDEPFAMHRHQGLILGEDNRKMSKRWGNVINPTDVVNEYGADTLRMYEMFMGPLEQAKAWSTNSVRGVRKFLERVWRLQEKVSPDAVAHPALEMLMHKTIKKVSEDTAALQCNTAIAQMMQLTNECTKASAIPQTLFEQFIKLLAPYAPHIAEELWEALGHTDSVTVQPWPTYDEAKLIEDVVTVVVQINGKVRASIEIAADAPEATVTKQALEAPNVLKWLEGKDPKKIIYVPQKLVSIVV